MTWDPGPMKFWDGVYEHPKEYFDPKDEAMSQAQYLLQHPEIQALASLFVAHMTKKPRHKPHEVLKEAGLFFTRPADVLKAEVDDVLRKTHKDGPREELKKKHRRFNAMPRYDQVPNCTCSLNSETVESVYSSFISRSTSASTLPRVVSEAPVTPTIDEAIWMIVTKALDKALNIMYSTRDHQIFYDESHLCLIRCLQKTVETIWGPRIQEINDIIDSILDDVIKITSEKRKLKLLMTNKLPSKVNRLRNNFKGFEKSEDYPDLTKKEILETLNARKGEFNRYPKDIFGVYLPAGDKSLDLSTTYIPLGCKEEDYSHKQEAEHSLEDLPLDEED